MRALVLAFLVAASACSSKKQAPPPGPAAQDKLPEVTAKVDAPPAGEKVVLGSPESHALGEEKDPTKPALLVVDPEATYATLIDEARTLRRSSFMLLVHTPQGVGALPLPLPRATTGAIDDEPILVLAIARSATGEPQLILGATPVAEAELERALRDSHRTRVALVVDKATTVGDFARILAIVHGVVPNIGMLVEPKPPIELPQKR